MGDIDPGLQYLLDRQAIADCVNRYARGLDRHDDEMVASAYHWARSTITGTSSVTPPSSSPGRTSCTRPTGAPISTT